MTQWWLMWRRPAWWGSATLAIALLLAAEYFWYAADFEPVASDLVPALPQSTAQKSQRQVESSLSLFARYDQSEAIVTETVSGNSDTLSAELQAQQQGLLRKLYIDKQIYQLSAILQQQQLIAVLSVYTADGQYQQHLALKQGDVLGEYRVAALSQQRLTLQQGERKLWLELFIPSAVANGDKA